MITLTVVSCVAVIVSSMILFNRELDNTVHDKVQVAASVVESEIEAMKVRAQVAAFGMAANPDLIEALINNDRDDIIRIANTLKTMTQIDFCNIVDSEGYVITRTHAPETYGDNISNQPHVRKAMDGHSSTNVTQGAVILLGVYAGAPVYDSDMNIIGLISLGFRLDLQDFAYRLKELTGCEISAFLKDECISSTLLSDDGSYILGSTAPEYVTSRVMSGEPHIGRTYIDGKEVLAEYMPVFGAQGTVLGMIFVGYYTLEDTVKLYNLILIGALIALMVLSASVLIARSISATIERRLVGITELEAEKEAAEQSNRLKGIFLAQMSHEIRTPMNAILGISEIQLRDTTLTQEAEDGYRKIYESGNLLLNIINDILDFSKIDAGKMEIIIDRYDIPSLLNDTALLNRMRYESKPLEFNLQVDENTPLELIGDELRIRQILNNLLSNAFKYTEEGEVGLSISVEDAAESDAMVGDAVGVAAAAAVAAAGSGAGSGAGSAAGSDAAADGGDDIVILVLKVSDTGQGMTEKQIEVLFDEFTRFNIDANRSVSGTGLGMNITKRLLEIMNGKLSVESELGKGSVFTVRLPQRRSGTAVCGSEVAERLRSFTFRNDSISGKAHVIHEYMPYGRILIVDDVESNLYVAKGMMLPYGLHIDTAVSGFQAIKMAESNQEYDIIFMDHMMPRMDGIEATKLIHESGYTRPIIALTANAVVGQAEMFLANGFDDFIAKPIDSRRLDVLLKTYVRDKHPPEVVEAAREQASRQKAVGETLQSAASKRDLLKVIVQDIEKALTVLEDLLPKIRNGDDTDLGLFTTTVHGMKSVLLNIGEAELATAALRLEQAGETGEMTEISTDTPTFVNALQSIVERHAPDGASNAASGAGDGSLAGDEVFLKEKLGEIKSACERIKKRDARAALDELRAKAWPHETSEILDEISTCLLHGEFKKAVSIADGILSADS